MHKALTALGLLAALVLAGCSEDHTGVDPATCPDGTVLTAEQLEQLPDHHAEGFNGTAQCPVAPSVSLDGVPTSLGAFRTGPFSWTLDNGTVARAHSMLTSIRWHSSSVPDADLAGMSTYPNELIKREHQGLPITYRGNLTFTQAGTVYLRAYMEVSGKDYWSPEVALQILPVEPTGTVHEVTLPAGAGLAGTGPTPNEVAAKLGDALQLVDEDPVGTKCDWQSGPLQTNSVTAEAPIVLAAPGTYEYQCDSVQPTSFSARVTVE